MIALLRSATAKRDRPAAPESAPGDNSVTRILPVAAVNAMRNKVAPVGEKQAQPRPAEPERPEAAEEVAAAQADGGARSGRTKNLVTGRAALAAGGVAAVLVLLGVWAVIGGDGGSAPLAGSGTGGVVAPVVPATSASPTGSVVPQAAARPVRGATDLDQVCGNTYFPAAPKYRGKAPHPIVISARDRLDLDQRSTRTLNRYAYGSKLAQRTWAPAPAKAQLVACLDLIGGGAKVKDCPGDGKAKLPLKVGRYRLSLYEVATRRKIAEATLDGADKACPWVVMTGADQTLYTTLDDTQLYRVLRPKVAQDASAQPKKRS